MSDVPMSDVPVSDVPVYAVVNLHINDAAV